VLGTELFADDFTLTVGGSAIVAAGLHRLGARVGLIAELGTDYLSRVMREILDDLGLDRSLIREHGHPLPQVTVALSFPQDRAFVTRFRRPQTAPDLAGLLRAHPARHLHVGSLLAALETPEAARIAHAAGLTVSMDPGWDENDLLDPRLAAMIADLDVFLPNRSELCHLGHTEDVEEALARVGGTMRGGLLVLKMGADGAAAYAPSGETVATTGPLPVTPLDTTGAGDAFDAGFLYGYVNGLPVETCMRYGAVCGGLATTRAGGVAASPGLTEVQQWLSRLPS
jgi:sugar/nucleoside kinase (ribokinase family)